MATVTLQMKDLFTEASVERTIDISNISVYDGVCNRVLTNPEKIISNLNEWIQERGNEQHNTILELISYSIEMPTDTERDFLEDEARSNALEAMITGEYKISKNSKYFTN